MKLVPQLLISRSCLSLSYFDLGADSYGSIGSRVFSASELTLEVLTTARQRGQEESVLIAERDEDHRLYAVELVRQGIYALCRLGGWVRLEDFGKPVTKAKKLSHGDYATTATHDSQWWRKAALDLKSGMRETERTSETQGIRLLMKPPPSRMKLATVKDSTAACVNTSDTPVDRSESMSVIAVNGCDQLPQPPSTDSVDIYGMIRAQYLETLYINKVSSECINQVKSIDQHRHRLRILRKALCRGHGLQLKVNHQQLAWPSLLNSYVKAFYRCQQMTKSTVHLCQISLRSFLLALLPKMRMAFSPTRFASQRTGRR